MENAEVREKMPELFLNEGEFFIRELSLRQGGRGHQIQGYSNGLQPIKNVLLRIEFSPCGDGEKELFLMLDAFAGRRFQHIYMIEKQFLADAYKILP